MFIALIVVEFSSKWPACPKLEMADMHKRQHGELKGLFLLFLVSKPPYTIG
jgi:hypothetical protein